MTSVLLADDEEFVRFFLRTVLENNLYDVVEEVESGDMLLQAMKDYEPDILLLDINMPMLTGIEFLQKHAHKFPETCIIILTSAALTTLVGEASLAGAKCFLRKDTPPEEMLEAIDKTWIEFRKGKNV